MELRHLARDAKTALELGLVAFAPDELVDRLATVAGLLDAASELPEDSPPVITLVPKLIPKAKKVLAEWANWHDQHLAKTKV
jgi:hypothetical protein